MLASGSSGNATYINTGEEEILVDAGLSGREIKRRLEEIQVDIKDIKALLLTHEHQDHTRGAGVLSRQLDIPIMATSGTWKGVSGILGEVDPVNRVLLKEPFQLGGIKIELFPLPHDALEPVGFIFDCYGVRIGMATDIGCIKEEMLEALGSCHLVILEANHDLELLKYGSYPPFLKKRVMGPTGHLSNDDAGYAATALVKRGVSQLILGHLSKENNHPQLAYHTVKNMLEVQDIIVGKDLNLSLVEHKEQGRLVRVG